MATTRQIEANRRNARKSTGPRSAEGKAISRLNALKTGIDARSHVIHGEDPCDLDTLAAEYRERFRPATPEARCLVDTLVNSEWLLRRLRRAEAEIWEYEAPDWADDDEEPHPLGLTFIRAREYLNRLQRRIDSTQRNYHRALKELQRLQPETPPAPSEIGFVPSLDLAPFPDPRPIAPDPPLLAPEVENLSPPIS